MLKIENLHVYYGGIHALRGINMEVADGQIISLIGANGAGKSTTLKAIMSLVQKPEGHIEFDGTDISKMNTTDKSNPNVCIIQCALFAKGYNAGGITGIYYTTGVNAVKQYQGEAGLPVTGIIDWKVWMGLVSINWFRKYRRLFWFD